ncbi:MAG TPA: NmrA family NAD(P)-binding protein [Steroidobacteraceae bacterium]|nr:NmrA family NAD(P)-binding protein [Steroidobacteraceae bacterium]
MIFVSGANGKFANAVISSLLEATDAKDLAVGTRDVESAFARELAARGVSVRHADYNNPALMQQALQGVDKALFIPTYDPDELRLRQNLNALEAAQAAGLRHVVYASFLNAASPLVEHSRLVHYPTERALAASGLGHTILRHALYADLLVADLQETLQGGVFRRPGGKARCAYVARADLGYSAAQVLLREEPRGRVYSETMEQAWSGEEVAALMSAVFGRPVRYDAVAATDWPQYMTSKWGVPPEISRSTVGTMQAVEAGEFDVVTQDYRSIAGRPARTLRQFLESVRDAAS